MGTFGKWLGTVVRRPAVQAAAIALAAAILGDLSGAAQLLRLLGVALQ